MDKGRAALAIRGQAIPARRYKKPRPIDGLAGGSSACLSLLGLQMLRPLGRIGRLPIKSRRTKFIEILNGTSQTFTVGKLPRKIV